jgi:hypothetical protein
MMHTCTCRNCSRVVFKRRPNPFCGPTCRAEYNQLKQLQQSAILTGAPNDASNTSNTKV